jgi:hypothetical protein
MDDRVTYGTPSGIRATIYLEDADDAPDDLILRDGTRLLRLSDISLVCYKDPRPMKDPDNQKRNLPTGCGGFDCHRMVLGQCQCGYHDRPTYGRAEGVR